MHLERLIVVSALPPDGGWRADLAVDRSTSPPRPVLVAHVPPAVAGDALALARLARGLDLSGRVEHRALRRLLGTGELDGDLVLVEAWREGATLRAVLDAAGPLTQEVAARVAVDLAGALHAGHALPAALGKPLCHGAIGTDRILLAADGQVLLCGMGRPVRDEVTSVDDLRALARVVLESLAPAGDEGPGALEAACHRVLVGEGYPSAMAFAEAVAAAVTPAGAAAVAARAEASQPAGAPDWLARRQALARVLGAEGEAAVPPAQPEPEAGRAGPAADAAAAPAVEEWAPRPVGPPAVSHQPVELAGDGPPPVGAGSGRAEAVPLQAWIQHPWAPVAVGVTLGLLGLLLGFALGGRGGSP